MGKINGGRVFLGGMAAGAFSVATQYIAVFLLGEPLRPLRQAIGMPHYSAADQLTIAAAEVLIGGPLAIWFYAAIRPRFGAGPRTAVITAVWIWFTLGPYLQIVVGTMGFMKPIPLGVILVVDVVFLPFIVAAVVIGAWLYKEEATAANAAAG